MIKDIQKLSSLTTCLSGFGFLELLRGKRNNYIQNTALVCLGDKIRSKCSER